MKTKPAVAAGQAAGEATDYFLNAPFPTVRGANGEMPLPQRPKLRAKATVLPPPDAHSLPGAEAGARRPRDVPSLPHEPGDTARPHPAAKLPGPAAPGPGAVLRVPPAGSAGAARSGPAQLGKLPCFPGCGRTGPPGTWLLCGATAAAHPPRRRARAGHRPGTGDREELWQLLGPRPHGASSRRHHPPGQGGGVGALAGAWRGAGGGVSPRR